MSGGLTDPLKLRNPPLEGFMLDIHSSYSLT